MSEAVEDQSVFDTLRGVEIDNKLKQKGNGGQCYVSWSIAVREMLKRYPDANWNFSTWGEGLPYLSTKAGAFVECTVTINGIARTQMMPVLDHRNQPLDEPNSFQVNKSQMRALTKAIALHGFGLQLWAGEDFDQVEEDRKASLVDEHQIANIIAEIQAAGIDEAMVCRKGRIGAIQELEIQRFDGMIGWIKKQGEES